MLHVFDDACNLINDDSDVIALVTPHVGEGPFSIVVPPVRFPEHISAAASVVCLPDRVIIGALAIDLSLANTWNPRPPWSEIRAAHTRFTPHILRLLDVLRESAPAGSLADLLFEHPAPGSAVKESTLRIAQAATQRVLAGVQSGDANLCLQGAVALAGLGSGLTPSGDDWLMGCILATWAGFSHSGAALLANQIAQAAARRTTPLSAAWLRAAARGECGIRWHRLFDGLSEDNPTAVMKAARSIIQQGHTSGSDALAGLVAMLSAR